MGKFSMLGALGVLALLAVTRGMPQPGSNSPSEESAEARKMMEEVRAACRNNSGSDEAFVVLTEAMQSASVCVMNSFDVVNFTSDVDTISNATRSTFFPKYCPQLRRAGLCLDDVLKAGRPCLNKELLTLVRALASMYPPAVDMICKNDGEIIFKLAEPKYEQCVGHLRDNVMECTVPFSVECENWDFSNLTRAEFRTLSGLRQCIRDKLNVCKAPHIIRVYDVFHNTVFRLASCDNVRPFLENVFVDTVQFLSAVTDN